MKEVPPEESIRLIYPRLTVLVTTVNPAGEINAAPYSFIAPVSFSPPMLYLGIQRRETLTVKNIRRKKEFVVNVVTRDWGEKAVICGAKLADKVEKSGLEFEEGKKVAVPRVKSAKIVLECRLKDIIESGQADHFLILGEIVKAEKDPTIKDEDLVMHISGETFVSPGKSYSVERKE
jgi:flavin reductase (DIM6/NTAB) family NADH-FMN oxidoreductase RutF